MKRRIKWKRLLKTTIGVIRREIGLQSVKLGSLLRSDKESKRKKRRGGKLGNDIKTRTLLRRRRSVLT